MKDSTKTTRQSGNSSGPVTGGINLAAYQVEIIPQRIQFSDEVRRRVAEQAQRQARGDIRGKIEKNFRDDKRKITVVWECDQIKAKALNEIRRRMATATDERQRVKLLVLEKAVENDLMIEQVGEIVDVGGKVFGYAFGLFHADPEAVSDLLAYISASAIDDDGRERFARYAERANQAFKLDEHQKEGLLKLIYAYLGVCG